MAAAEVKDSKIFIDEPDEEVFEDFKSITHTVKETILHSNPQFAVAVFGGWGEGKSSVMRSIQKELENEKKDAEGNEILDEDGNEKYKIIWFNAWQYEKEEHHATIPLILSILDEIDPKQLSLGERIKKYVNALFQSWSGDISLPIPGLADSPVSLNAHSFVEALRSEKDKTADKYLDKTLVYEGIKLIQEELKINTFTKNKEEKAAFNKPNEPKLIIFIDDLDRCNYDRILEMLDSIKILMNTQGIVFVLGLDRDIIIAAIENAFPNLTEEIGGAQYLQKFIQIPIMLPEWTEDRTKRFLEKLNGDKLNKLKSRNNQIRVEEINEDEQVRDEQGRAGEIDEDSEFAILKELSGDIAKVIEKNPRQIKRFLNAILMARDIDKTNVEEASNLAENNPMKTKYGKPLNFKKLVWLNILDTKWSGFVDIMLNSHEMRSKLGLLLKEYPENQVPYDFTSWFVNTLKAEELWKRVWNVKTHILKEEMDTPNLNKDKKKDAEIIEKLASQWDRYKEGIHLARKIRTSTTVDDLLKLLYEEKVAEFNDVRKNKGYTFLNLEGETLVNLNLKNVDFRGAYLKGADLRFSNLEGADLTHANLQYASLRGTNFTNANLHSANLLEAVAYKSSFKGASLREAELKKATLYKSDFRNSNVSFAILDQAKIWGCDFENSDLRNTRLFGTKIEDCEFSRTKFLEEDLRKSDFELKEFNDMGAVIEQEFYELKRDKYEEIIYEEDPDDYNALLELGNSLLQLNHSRVFDEEDREKNKGKMFDNLEYAKECYEKIPRNFEKQRLESEDDDKIVLAHTQGNLGIYFERMADVKPDDYQELFRQSLEKHVESLKLHYEQKSSYDCLNDLLNIGVVYIRKGIYDKEFYQHAIKINQFLKEKFELLGSKEGIAYACSNQAFAAMRLGDSIQIVEYIERPTEPNDEDVEEEKRTMMEKKKKLLNDARENLEKTVAIDVDIDFPWCIAVDFKNLSHLARTREQFKLKPDFRVPAVYINDFTKDSDVEVNYNEIAKDIAERTLNKYKNTRRDYVDYEHLVRYASHLHEMNYIKAADEIVIIILKEIKFELEENSYPGLEGIHAELETMYNEIWEDLDDEIKKDVEDYYEDKKSYASYLSEYDEEIRKENKVEYWKEREQIWSKRLAK